ncbi:MAG TPA: bifunctional diguanylate cyclase/phosphodiesterase [Rhodanobacteraceae bacterium]|nr:bifunctional diguanylate cyclase/phosphodiesterase [Rhodanobacteraceae bacterium]
MNGTAKAGSSLLIVTGDRSDRRALFDALDAENFDAIYTARDVAQARSFIEQDPHIDLLLLQFDSAAEQAAAFCTWLKEEPAFAATPIIGILGSNAAPRRWGYLRRPPGVIEWIRSPVDGGEALFRVRAVLHARAPQGEPPAPPAESQDYRFAFDASPDELVISDPHNGQILEVNATFERRTGRKAREVLGRPLSSIDASGSREQRKAFADQLLDKGSARIRFLKPRPDGGRYPVEMHAQLAVRGGRMVQFNAIREVGALLDVQQALATLVALFAGTGGDEGMQRGVQVLGERMALDYVALAAVRRDGQVPQVLAQYQRVPTPLGAPDIGAQPALKLVLDGEALVHLDDAQRLAEVDDFVRESEFAGFIGLPLQDNHRNVLGAMLIGSRRSLKSREGVVDTLRVAASRFAFELQLRLAREQGRAQGLHDALTGLPNRLLFNDRLESTLREAQRTGEMFAVLFLDLDRFKTINDSLGHSIGDQVLSAVARRLGGSVRASDTVARYAGDEFTLILRHIVQREDVLRIAEKIVRVLEAPLTLEDGSELHITASLGVSFHPDDADNAEALLKHADVAMYSAKGLGRNNFQTYVAVPEESHQQRIALEAKLRVAERNNELRVYYQPQVDAGSEDIVGMEALIRWEHPELGMISPGFFIPLAEETGLIVSIGEWVLRTACADARRWQQKYQLPLRIGVNLSALQLRQPNLVELVSSVIEQTGIEPRLLDLEVTESINVRDIPNLLDTLGAIRKLGCGISIDDFGTGQSSLDYLRHVPADRIKIDQSFVRNIGIDPDDEAIVRATITMAHNLKHSVVAEGVEIEQHLEFLRAHGCEELQGYLFCRPLPAAGFENLLAERARLRAPAAPAAPPAPELESE